jgi:predicted Zn-dependent peptidase
MSRLPHFNRTQFDNGFTVLSERLPQFKSLALGIWAKVGTRHETCEVAGVSHFLEHMLFKGTKNRSALQIAQAVDQVGGEFNAFTARENTCFHILLLERDLNLGVEILTDVLMNSLFKLEEMERERKVILQEIAMVDDSPEELVYDLFFEKVYGGHSLGRPILGTRKSVKGMARRHLVDFFRNHYRPDRLIFSVAGNVDHKALVRKLKPLGMKNWGPSGPDRKIVSEPDPQVLNGFWWSSRPTEQVHLIWGVRGPHYSSQDRFAAFLLNVYLGGGMSSSLFQEIREKNGLAYTVYSNLTPFIDSGLFSIYVATGMAQVPLCLKLIERCVVRLKKKCLTKKELKVIQDNLKGTILLSSDCVESRMSSIAKNEIFLNRYVSLEQVCKEIDSVSPEDVQRVAKQLFQDPGRSIMVLGPKPPRSILSRLPPVTQIDLLKF